MANGSYVPSSTCDLAYVLQFEAPFISVYKHLGLAVFGNLFWCSVINIAPNLIMAATLSLINIVIDIEPPI